MGAALRALGDLGQIAVRTPGTVGLVGVVAIGIWLASWVFSAIPYLGFIASILVFAFGIGAMYAVANHGAVQGTAAGEPAIDLLRRRWLSLLGAYAILLGVALVISLLVIFPLFVLGAIALVNDATIGIWIVAGILAYGALLWFVATMFLQFLYPAIAIENVGAIDAGASAVDIVREQPISAIGFTLMRIALEYVPFVSGIVVAVALGWDAFVAVVEAYLAILEEPGTPPGDPPEFLPLLVEFAGIDTLLAMFALVVIGGVIGEIMRILYTTAFYRVCVSTDT